MPRDIAHINLFNPWVIMVPFSILGLMCGLVICTEEIYALLSILCVLLAFFLYYQFIGSIMAMYFFLSLMGMTQPYSVFHIPATLSLPFNPIFIVNSFTLLALLIYLVLKNPGKLHELFRLRLSWKSYELYFVVFCSFVLVTSFFSVDQWQTFKRLLSFVLTYFLFIKVVKVSLLKKDNIYIVFNFVFYVFLFITVARFNYLFTGELIVPTSHVQRLEVFTSRSFNIAMDALILFNLALIQTFITKRQVWKIGYTLVSIMALLMCILTNARSVALACLVSFSLWFFLGGFMNRKKPFNFALLVSVVAFFFAFVVYQNLDLLMYFSVGKETMEDIFSDRIFLWESAIKYTWDNHLFTGIGLGNASYFVQGVLHRREADVISTFVGIFLVTGLIGVITYTLYLVWLLIEPLRVYLKGVRGARERTLMLGCFILCLAIFIVSLFENTLDSPVLPEMQIVLLCVATAEAIKTFPQDSSIMLREKRWPGKIFVK